MTSHLRFVKEGSLHDVTEIKGRKVWKNIIFTPAFCIVQHPPHNLSSLLFKLAATSQHHIRCHYCISVGHWTSSCWVWIKLALGIVWTCCALTSHNLRQLTPSLVSSSVTTTTLPWQVRGGVEHGLGWHRQCCRCCFLLVFGRVLVL